MALEKITLVTLLVAGSAVIGYLFLTIPQFKKNLKPEEQLKFSSFFLWSIIDAIMWVNIIIAKTDQTLIATYTVCTTFLTIILLIKKRHGWDTTDTKVGMVAFCSLIISIVSFVIERPIIGVTCAALSISIAGIPHLTKIATSKPTQTSYWIILFFLIGPCINIIDFYTKSGEVVDYIYPAIAITYWFTAFILTQRAKNLY